LLVLHYIYYPGWIAEVDGKTVPIQRSGALFWAVEVPSGTHSVTFHFAPFSSANLRDALNSALGRAEDVAR
jgi:uncharacterized membrane protein YfhO